ncbi:MAG: class I SAM-dependent methyltransferase [Pseudomonadota bacterium]
MKAVIVLGLGLALNGTALAQDHERLWDAVSGDHRSAADAARNEYRNPYQTLLFMGVEPDDTVVEIFPGAGWYSAILAPYLRDDGQLIAAGYPRDESASAFMRQLNATYDELLASDPVYDSVEIAELTIGGEGSLAPDGSVDMILDFRNAHNWLQSHPERMLGLWHAALQPGGIVGIVDHRMDPSREAGNGYIHEQSLIEVMEDNGFRYVARSNINANPDDTRDHPGGVWNLPPNVRDVPDDQRHHYLAIGESDRLTMKFVKQ